MTILFLFLLQKKYKDKFYKCALISKIIYFENMRYMCSNDDTWFLGFFCWFYL